MYTIRKCTDGTTCPLTSGCGIYCVRCDEIPKSGEVIRNFNIEYNSPKDSGWVCPKCGNVYAPWFPSCTKCNKE